MDVEDSIGESGNEFRGEQAHVAGQTDQIDFVASQAGEDVGIVVGAGAAFGDKELMRKAEAGCGFEAGGVGSVGDDDGNLDSGEAAFADGLGDGEEVGAAAGEENSESDRSIF